MNDKAEKNSDFTEKQINRLDPELCQTKHNDKSADEVLTLLDKAINYHQSDHIEKARNELRDVFELILKVDARNFKIPTKFGWQVVNRGKAIFFDGHVSCSLKHGTIVLDSSNGGAQFFPSLLTVVGSFALETSEFHMSKEIFTVLIKFHVTSVATSRLRDLASAFNNRGCLSLIVGDFDQADSDFKNSLRHFKLETQKQLPGSSADAMILVVESNTARLELMSRNFAHCLEQQEKLVETCKFKMHELPLQTILMVMHNQILLHTTLQNLAKAEKELKWLISYCKEKRREECDLLLNFVSLQLCEVLLLQGRPKEAEKAFPYEALTSADVHEIMPTFGGLHFNVRIEAFEKTIDVLVQCGKIKFACILLKKG